MLGEGQLWDRCAFTLFPYVSGGDFGRDSVRWAHEAAVAELRAGVPHPLREAVLERAWLAHEHDEAWQGLTDAERDIVLTRD